MKIAARDLVFEVDIRLCCGTSKPSHRSFALSCCPFRLDFYEAFDSCCVVSVAAPLPVLRSLAQSLLHRIAVNISQLLHKLVIVPDIEIVITLLPEVFCFADQSPRDTLLERFDGMGERVAMRFAEQQVNVLRHDDIAEDA